MGPKTKCLPKKPSRIEKKTATKLIRNESIKPNKEVHSLRQNKIRIKCLHAVMDKNNKGF